MYIRRYLFYVFGIYIVHDKISRSLELLLEEGVKCQSNFSELKSSLRLEPREILFEYTTSISELIFLSR